MNATMKVLFSFLITLTLTTAAMSANAPPSHLELTRTAIDTHIIPHIDAMKRAAEALPPAVEAVCKTGSEEARRTLDEKFAAAVTAYAGIDFLRFGPMLENGRREQISFWPDPRGFVGRQLRMILLNKDAKLGEPGALAKQSAAVQGLPALEFLMRDSEVPLGPTEPAQFRCVMAQAIAHNIVRVVGEVSDGWEKPGGWKDKMLSPGPDNDTYRNENESAVEIVKAFLMGISLTADLQLKPQVDTKIRLSPPYNKSGLQKQVYAASIASLRQLYDAMHLEAYLKPDMAWMKGWSQGTWRTIESIDGAGGRSSHAQRKDTPTSREVFDRMNGLRNIVANRLSTAAGLTVGFNELDGD